jgi:hypothetical protein
VNADCTDTCQQFNGDGCENDCTDGPVCGDGYKTFYEECDTQGNAGCDAGDICNADCTECITPNFCGDGIVDADGPNDEPGDADDEECDPGYTCPNGITSCNPYAANPCGGGLPCTLKCDPDNPCTDDCREPTCLDSDGIPKRECGEECVPEFAWLCEHDHGITCTPDHDVPGGVNSDCPVIDTCDPVTLKCTNNPQKDCTNNLDADCTILHACEAVLDDPPDEACCDLTCSATGNIGCDPGICGNGIPEADEQCDDGMRCIAEGAGGVIDCTLDDSACATTCIPWEGDGCSEACEIEECGNDIEDPGEDCDDGKECALDPTFPCTSDEQCSAHALCLPQPVTNLLRCPDGSDCLTNADCTDVCQQHNGDGCDNDCTEGDICGDNILGDDEACEILGNQGCEPEEACRAD